MCLSDLSLSMFWSTFVDLRPTFVGYNILIMPNFAAENKTGFEDDSSSLLEEELFLSVAKV